MVSPLNEKSQPSKLKNKGLGVYFYYKQPKIGAVGAENFEVFLVF